MRYTIPTAYNQNDDLQSANTLFKLAAFLICPFVAFLIALLKPASKSSYLIYFIFGMLFSWSMFYNDPTNYIDFIAISQRFYEVGDNITLSDILESFTSLWSNDSQHKDIYNLLINWITHLFSDNFHTMYVVASVPYLFLMLGSLKNITNNRHFSIGISCYFILALFILPKDIFNIQNFRFSTASWLMIYSCLSFFYKGQKSAILLMLLTPLVHSSFYLFIGIFLLYFCFQKFQRTIIFVFYISIPFAFIGTDTITLQLPNFLPAYLQEWSDSYLSTESIQQFKTGINISGTGFYFIRIFFDVFQRIMYLLIPIIIIHNQRALARHPDNIKKLFYFFLLFLTIVNFIQPIPVLGKRFWEISRILNIFLWFIIIYPTQKTHKFLFILSASWFYEIIYQTIPHYEKVLSSDFYIMNVFYLISKYWNVTSF